MDQLDIKYNVYLKNKGRKSASYVLRVRQDGKVKDVPLRTQDPKAAKEALEKAKFSLQAYNYNPSPALLEAVVRIGAPQVQHEASGGSVSIREGLEAWEVQMRREGAREASIRCYLKSIRRILDESASIRTVADTDAILAKCDGLASATRHLYSAALRNFRGFVESKYGIRYDPREIPRVRVDPVKRQTQWTILQMRKIIDAVRITKKGYHRDLDEVATEDMKTYLWLLATSGLRQGEAYQLRWTDIDWEKSMLNLRAETTKGRKARSVPIQNYVLDRLSRKYRELPGNRGRIFERIPKDQSGRFAVLRRAIDTANTELEEAGSRMRIPPGGLHSMRHSCCCILYSRDPETGERPDIRRIAEILGHSAQVSLQYYVRCSEGDEGRDLINSRFDTGEMRSTVDDCLDLI